MKSVSFRDLQLIPELSNLSEIEMLHPERDVLIKKYLSQMAFDCDYDVEYIPSVHRDLQNNTALGFRAVGEISINRNDINSVYSDLTDRLVAASITDPSLMFELAELAGKTLDFEDNSEDSLGLLEEPTIWPSSQLNDDWEDVEKQIKALEELRDAIRLNYNN